MSSSSAKPTIKVENDYVVFDSTTKISFERTLRIPDDGKIYPLPPSFGHFPVSRVDDYLEKVPESWKKTGGVFIPMFQREAMWMEFNASAQQPRAVKVAIGKVNAVSGETWSQKLTAQKEDYLVIPDQQWLDGINAGNGVIKQFVAMPLGGGYTVEAQVTGKEDVGGIQLIVYQPKPGKFRQQVPTPVPTPTPVPVVKPYKPIGNPSKPIPPPVVPAYSPAVPQHVSPQPSYPPPYSAAPMKLHAVQASYGAIPEMAKAKKSVQYESKAESFMDFAAPPAANCSAPRPSNSYSAPPAARNLSTLSLARPAPPVPQQEKAQEMGLAAGGKMNQKIYADKYGVDTWDEDNFGRIFIHIVNSAMYEQITGKKPPATPIDASAYTNFGFPWYNVYDEGHSTVAESSVLSNVKSVKEIDQQKYAWPQQNDSTVNISGSQVVTYKKEDKSAVRDGDW